MAENWNRPCISGVFSPYPKNPVIEKFFKEIGRIYELRSGFRNTFKYCSIYTPETKPQFIEDDVFRTIIPLKAKKREDEVIVSGWDNVRMEVRRNFGEKLGESSEKILELILRDQYISASVMDYVIGVSAKAVEKQLKKLKSKGVINRIGPDKGGFWKINI